MMDFIWITCLFAANILIYIRKFILVKTGYSPRISGIWWFRKIWSFKDRGRMCSLAREQTSLVLKLLFFFIAYGVSIFFIVFVATLYLANREI